MTTSNEKAYNLGFLNGWLKAIAKINEKTNHGYDFSLSELPSTESLKVVLDDRFNYCYEVYKIKKIANPQSYLIDLLCEDWLFEFQRKEDDRNLCLEDQNGNFTLSYIDFKKEWVKEFVELLLKTTEHHEVYDIEAIKFKKVYIGHRVDIIIVGRNRIYHLYLCLMD